jgi:hypothetical protein
MAEMFERLDPGLGVKIDSIDEGAVDVENDCFDHVGKAPCSGIIHA